MVGTTATSALAENPYRDLEINQLQLGQIVEQMETMSIQLEAGSIDRRMHDRRRQQESAVLASRHLLFLDNLLPGIEISTGEYNIPIVDLVDALNRFDAALAEQNEADLGRLSELQDKIPDGQELTTPLLNYATMAAFNALQARLAERK